MTTIGRAHSEIERERMAGRKPIVTHGRHTRFRDDAVLDPVLGSNDRIGGAKTSPRGAIVLPVDQGYDSKNAAKFWRAFFELFSST